MAREEQVPFQKILAPTSPFLVYTGPLVTPSPFLIAAFSDCDTHPRKLHYSLPQSVDLMHVQ